MVEDPKLIEVGMDAKLEVIGFNGDRDPKVLFDWLHSLESFFRGYQMKEERKLHFSKARLRFGWLNIKGNIMLLVEHGKT